MKDMIGSKVIVDGVSSVIVDIKGRWVKLEDGRNISRDQASAGFEAQIEADNEAAETTSTNHGNFMAQTLAAYRKSYVVTKIGGRKSADTGDAVAVKLRGLELHDVLDLADLATGEVQGTHAKKYSRLNVGQQRMNAGNRIRAAVKSGKLSAATLDSEIAIITEFYNTDPAN